MRPRPTPVTASGGEARPERGVLARAAADGFTMIELLVGITLLALVIALVVSVIAKTWGTVGSSQSSERIDNQLGQAVDQLTSDLQRVRAPDRNTSDIRSPESLLNGVARGAVVRSEDPAAGNRVLLIDDVLLARPNRLDVLADVDPTTAGVECVSWQAGVASGKWTVRRRAFRPGIAGGAPGVVNTGCTGTEITNEVVVSSSNATAAPTSLFSYELVCNPAVCTGVPAPPTGPTAGAPCTPWPRASITTPRELRWVSGISANLKGEAFRNDAGVALRNTSVSITIRSRSGSDYRQAAGCA